MSFLSRLRQRNQPLFWFGLFNIVTGVVCLILMQLDDRQVLNVSRWLKPMKFYFSVGIMILTMGWLLPYMDNARKIRRFTILLIITMFFENGLILLQAIRGTTSHFNNKNTTDSMIFTFMGIFIMVFIVTCIRICIAFFKQRSFSIPEPYIWGIRLGLLFFVIFSIEGGMMLSMMKHTVGGPDGSPGIPVLNWSKQYGDLRIAHFAGIHALQLLPLLGFYVTKTKKQIVVVSLIYFAAVTALFIQALIGIPLFS